jgi:predicted nucleotidyltransferase
MGDLVLVTATLTASEKPITEWEEAYQPILEALKQTFGNRLKTVVLFGSQARLESQPESDHDFLVVIEDLLPDPVMRQRQVRLALLPVLYLLPGPIGLIARTPEEIDAGLTPLLLDICVDGICLYGADYFEPYREMALAALRQSGLKRQRMGNSLMWVFPQIPTRNWELDWQGFRARK